MSEPQMTKEQLDKLAIYNTAGFWIQELHKDQLAQLIALAREGLRLREYNACKHGVVCSPEEHCSLCEDGKTNETISALTAELEQANERIKMFLAELDLLRKHGDKKLLWLWRNKENSQAIQWLRDRDDDTSLSDAIDSAIRKESQ